MNRTFAEFLSQQNFDRDQIDTIISYFEPKGIGKQEFFLETGQVCRQAAFVESGILMYFKVSESGEEMVSDFAREGNWVTQYESFINQAQSPLAIKAIEPTTVQVISFERVAELNERIPAFEKYTRSIIEKAFFDSINRMAELQTLKAEERYAQLLAKDPELLQRVPQYYLANYLGIAPQSLSRIRKNSRG